MLRTVDDVLAQLPPREDITPLPAPPYLPPTPSLGAERPRVALAVESMREHMSNEGFEVMLGLRHAGYVLCGHRLPFPEMSTTDAGGILSLMQPEVVLVQDKREWDVRVGDFRESEARFTHTEALAARPDVFKLTIVKDAHQDPHYHRQAAQEIGCHAWVVYYHPRIVHRLAPYTRPEHMIRVYHTVDPEVIPPFTPDSWRDRQGCLLSGALGPAYPLRGRLVAGLRYLPETTYLRHPGYHRLGSHTPEFLANLTRFKVVICTSSVYGYALRKLIEATACGCVVVTDLPSDEVLPEIDGNLVRVDPMIGAQELGLLLGDLYGKYDPVRQQEFATRAQAYYDYRAAGKRLAEAIEAMRGSYP